jgi:hypothetical protein
MRSALLAAFLVARMSHPSASDSTLLPPDGATVAAATGQADGLIHFPGAIERQRVPRRPPPSSRAFSCRQPLQRTWSSSDRRKGTSTPSSEDSSVPALVY